MPTVVEQQGASPELGLFELMLVRVARHLPTTAAAGDHLQVIPTDRAERPGIDDLLEFA